MVYLWRYPETTETKQITCTALKHDHPTSQHMNSMLASHFKHHPFPPNKLTPHINFQTTHHGQRSTNHRTQADSMHCGRRHRRHVCPAGVKWSPHPRVANKHTSDTLLFSQAMRKSKAGDFFDFVLVERKSKFHHNIGALRGVAFDSFIDQ